MAERRGGGGLSPRAREIQRQIREGRYEIDFEALAERLDGAFDGDPPKPSDDGAEPRQGGDPPVASDEAEPAGAAEPGEPGDER